MPGQTEHVQLSQFAAQDVPKWVGTGQGELGTYNGDMLKIDTAIGDIQDTINTLDDDFIPSGAGAIVPADFSAGAVDHNALAKPAVYADNIADGEVSLLKMAENSVDTLQLVNDSVTVDKLDNDAVTRDAILDGEVVAGKLGTDAVLSDNIDDDQILTAHIASYTGDGFTGITTPKIADGAITTIKIADVNPLLPTTTGITSAKIANNAVVTNAINDRAVTSMKIGFEQVLGAHIATGAIGATELAEGAVANSHILDGTIGLEKLAPISALLIKPQRASITANTNTTHGVKYTGNITAAYHSTGNEMVLFIGQVQALTLAPDNPARRIVIGLEYVSAATEVLVNAKGTGDFALMPNSALIYSSAEDGGRTYSAQNIVVMTLTTGQWYRFRTTFTSYGVFDTYDIDLTPTILGR